MNESSGAKANKTGNQLESMVQQTLNNRGYTQVPASEFSRVQTDLYPRSPMYTSQALIGKTVYGSDRKCDFLVYHPEKFPKNLVIECKWQQSAGSVDEKFPFLVENIRLLRIPTIIVVDGGGHKPGAVTWLKGQTDNTLIGVYTLIEFTIKINNGLC